MLPEIDKNKMILIVALHVALPIRIVYILLKKERLEGLLTDSVFLVTLWIQIAPVS